jgi:serine/threonine protein kinase
VRPSLASLTEAVADGQDIDWSSVDLSSIDAPDRERVAELRAIAEIGQYLATLTRNDPRSPSPAILESTSAFAPPRVWGSLEIREHVGRGRFGDVYRAWDPAIDRHVALKLLRDRGAVQSSADSIVVHEGRLMGRVRHPNVATIYGAANHEGRTGLWMEFIDGRTLEAELRDRGPFGAAEAAAIGIELCRALAAVHAAGLLHRDVKTQNVMRDATGRVVLGDFGTGLELDDDEGTETTIAGTPVYLAPEILKGEAATPRSDVYSLGVLLFHLVSGSYPVTGRSIGEIKRAHLNGARSRLIDLRPDVPIAFADAVERAIAPDHGARLASAAELEPLLKRSMGISNDDTVQRGALHSRVWLMAIPLAALTTAALVVPSSHTVIANFFGTSQRASDTGAALLSETRQMSRVPAPSQMQFWGRPSPDGRSYTFVNMTGDLGTFDTISGEQRILTDLEQVGGQAFESSTFSPDGQQIAYAWETKDGGRELRILPVKGGASRLVWSDANEVAHPLDWSRDGRDILVRLEGRDGTRALGLISSSNGVLRRLTAVDATHGSATLSPDGRYVVFDNSQEPEATERDVFIASTTEADEPAVLVKAQSDDFGPLWIPDSDRILFISDRTGEPSVWSVDVHSGTATSEPTILQRNIGRVVPSGISTKGKLFYSLQVGLVDVFQATLDLSRGEIVEGPRAVAPSQVGSKMNSDWSPDGRLLTYVLLPQAGPDANRSRRLVILDPATGDKRLLNPRLAFYSFPQWSPDGQHILVKGTDLRSRLGAYLVDVTTGDARSVAIVGDQTPKMIGALSWGPDSNTVLLTRNGVGLLSVDLKTGTERRVFDYASEGIKTITPGPGFRLSPDGQSVAYSAYRRNAAGKDETVLRVKTFGRELGHDLVVANVRLDDWATDSDILFTQFERGTQSISLWTVSVHGGSPRPMGLELLGLRNVGVHPDGRHLTFTSGFPGAELWALENFLSPR